MTNFFAPFWQKIRSLVERSRNLPRTLLWALGLIGSGLVLLIWTLELLAPYEPWPQGLMALLLALIGAGFFTKRLGMQNQWRFIPGWIMVSLVLMVLFSITPGVPDAVVAALLFLGVGTAFTHIYLLDRQNHWWAILSAGFNLVIFLMVAATSWTTNINMIGALLFGGMGAVFLLVYWLSPNRQHWWSLIPGAVLLLFGLVLLTAGQDEQQAYLRWWPLLFVLAGLTIVWFSDSQVGATRTHSTSENSPTATTHQQTDLSS